MGRTRNGKGTRCLVLVDGQGVPLGVHLSAATLAEGSLPLQTLDARATTRQPDRIVADRGHDASHLRGAMKAQGSDLTAPHLRTRSTRCQDGRKLRWYRRRRIIERTNAWLLHFRLLVVRHERKPEIVRAFIQLARAAIALRGRSPEAGLDVRAQRRPSGRDDDHRPGSQAA